MSNKRNLDFDIENEYKLYLKRMSLDENLMSRLQNQETKRAFMSGMGQMLIIMRNKVPELETEEALKVLDDLVDQITDYFVNEFRLNKM